MICWGHSYLKLESEAKCVNTTHVHWGRSCVHGETTGKDKSQTIHIQRTIHIGGGGDMIVGAT